MKESSFSRARTIVRQLSRTVLLATFIVATAADAFTATYHVIHRFTGGIDGGGAYAGVVFDAAGNLYGTAVSGGSGDGVVFRLSPIKGGGWKETVLYTFTGGNDGSQPHGGVILDGAGNVYGTTTFGGDPGCSCGVVFMLTPAKSAPWKETVMHAFTPRNDGANPGIGSGLIFDVAGNLYGTTDEGGDFFGGTFFRLSPSGNGSWNETVLYSFGNGGTLPNGPLVFDAAGNLYGTSAGGGAFDMGTVFKLSPVGPDNWTETVLYEFGGQSWNPNGGVIFDPAGNLYGTAMLGPFPDFCGGNGCGVVFQLSPNGNGNWNYTNIYTYHGHRDGAFPAAGLTFDAAGNLYGTTTMSGHDDDIVYTPFRFGTVFELSPANGGWQETILHWFGTPRSGARPQSKLVRDATGTVYGTTPEGGGLGQGVVFKIVP